MLWVKTSPRTTKNNQHENNDDPGCGICRRHPDDHRLLHLLPPQGQRVLPARRQVRRHLLQRLGNLRQVLQGRSRLQAVLQEALNLFPSSAMVGQVLIMAFCFTGRQLRPLIRSHRPDLFPFRFTHARGQPARGPDGAGMVSSKFPLLLQKLADKNR
jgi:hypothetical protein